MIRSRRRRQGNRFRTAVLGVILLLLATGYAAGEESAEARESPFPLIGRFVSRGELTAEPTVVGTTVVFASADRRLYAVAPGGEILWRADLGGRGAVPAAAAPGGSLALLTDQGELLLFDAENGSELWRRSVDLGGGEPSLVVDPEGVLFLSNGGDQLRAYSLSGKLLWQLRLSGPVTAPPILHRGAIYVATTGGILHTVDRGGKLRRRQRLAREVVQLLPQDDHLLALREDGVVLRYDQDGREVERFELASEELLGGFRRPGALLLDGLGGIVARYPGGGVAVFDGSGDYRWGDAAAELVTVTDGGILIASREGRGELRSGNGRLLWELDSGPGIRSVVSLPGYLLILYEDWAMSWYRDDAGAPVSRESWIVPGGTPGRTGASRQAAAGEWSDPEPPPLYLELFRSVSRRDRNRLLSAIERRVEEQSLAGRYRGIREITIAVALEPFRTPRYEGNTLLNDYPDQRARAAKLLGAWGDLPSREAVLLLLRRENAPEPLLAALGAAAEIPYDPEGETAASLASVLRRWRGSERVAAAVLAVMQGVRGELSDPGGEVLYTIATGAYSRELRAEALKTLRDFEKRQ